VARDPSVYIHPRALCETDRVGPRTRIWAFAHVMAGAVVGGDCNLAGHTFIEAGARIGDGVTVKNGVSIWDRVTVEDGVFIGPNAVFTNDRLPRASVKRSGDQLLPTLVRRGATIGANATIICGITVGEGAFVAAGAVVTRDVPAHALVAGNPARRLGWVCACGERLGVELGCGCGRRYVLSSEQQGLGIDEP
jgi:UDP-2-acetamido-3-amino-2,3-dideoxy-glucuronate N-acetyltransferase